MKSKILVVDDEQPIRNSLEKAFAGAGHSVVCAGSAEEALDVVQEERPQVMFLDLKLPGEDGVELCRRIRKDNPVAVVYALTGYTSVFDLVDCRTAGFDDYFVKPVELQTLMRAVTDAFEKLDRWKSG